MSQDQQGESIASLRNALATLAPQFKTVLPSEAHVDRFIRVVITAVQGNPDLLVADRNSFYAACMKCAQDGLMPDGKQAVLKIYNQKDGDQWVKTAAYEPMTDGLMLKLRLSGEIIGAPKVHCVYKNDHFEYLLGDDERIEHRPPPIGEPRGDLIGAYSIVKLQSGDISREIMSISEIDIIMNRTKSKKKDGTIFGPWLTDKPEMARKTVFKRHTKRLPRSSDLDNIINYDNEHNGVEGIERAPAAAPPPPVVTPQATHRPAALAKIVGEKLEGTPTAKAREPVTVDNGAQAGQDNGETNADSSEGPPHDII